VENQTSAERFRKVGAAIERRRALLNRFTNRTTSYVEFFSTPSELDRFFDANVTVYDLNNNEDLTSTWTECILAFFAKWGTSVRNQNNRSWPFEDGFFYRHEHMIKTPGGEEVFSPGFVVDFLHPMTGKIVRMEEYMDSYAVDPFLRTAFGETRRLDPVRRQPPWWNELESEVDVVDVEVSVDPDQLETVGRKIESNRRFMRGLDAVRARSTSWLGFLEGIKTSWSNDSTLWQLMDNCELGVEAAYERFRKLFGIWPNVRVENVRWWPFEEGVIQRMEYRFTTHGDVQLWCPGFALLFVENDKIVRWEDYFDSYSFSPILRTALGETRRTEKSRRQPPFR
jgi:hypothetical protein